LGHSLFGYEFWALAVFVIPRRYVRLAEQLAGRVVAFHAVRKTRLKQGPTLTDRPGFRPGEIRLT
jgi:4'-phosphopantetheinyl transferase EntD